MLWTHAYVMILVLAPPPCHPGDVDRFPPCVHEEQWSVDSEGKPSHCWITGSPVIDPRMNWLRSQRAMHLREWVELDEQIAEQERLEEVWKLLWYARAYRKTGNGHITIDRLQELRDIIGERAYALGEMPSPIPLTRYTEVYPR